jgi:uncharacterized damage-inducible protein DinB
MTDTLGLLARYNTRANGEMNRILGSLAPGEWTKDRGGYYPSFQALGAHLYAADVNWLVRFSGLRPFRSLKGEPFDFPPAPGSLPFVGFDEYREKRTALDAAFEAFVAELTPADLAADCSYRNFRGEELTKPFGGLVLHVFNHQTHHRGMVALYLDQMGVANDFSNLTALL